MKVLATWVFTFAQFKDIKVITDIIQQVKTKKRKWALENDDREVWLTTNDWPNFHMVTVHKVEENGEEEFYVHRPYYSWSTSRSGRIYSDTLLKASPTQKEELKKILK
jgi:hypothetical protein